MERIDIGDETYITAKRAQTRVRGGGAAGGRAWIALIQGSDPTYHFKREFLKKEPRTSRSGKSGTIEWTLPGDGLYEYRGFASSSKDTDGGFVQVKDGQIEEVSRTKATRIAEDLEPLNTITVRCRACDKEFKETEITEVTDIEEGLRGEDILSFKCPKCGEYTKSNRYG